MPGPSTRIYLGCLKKLSITLLSLQISLAVGFEDHPPPSNQVIHNRQIKGTTEVTIPIKGHTIYPPFVDTDLQNRWFDFGGSAIIDTNRHVRLTQNRASEAGHLWSRYPLTQPSFQVEVEFKIDGDSSSLYGDGMAVWLSKPAQQIGPVFGSADSTCTPTEILLFVSADEYLSLIKYAFPRILGMINHGYTSFDVGQDGDGQEAGACSYLVRRSDVATKLQINYVRGRFLEVNVRLELSMVVTQITDLKDLLPVTSHSCWFSMTNGMMGPLFYGIKLHITREHIPRIFSSYGCARHLISNDKRTSLSSTAYTKERLEIVSRMEWEYSWWDRIGYFSKYQQEVMKKF
ncbi:uncharacterized protein PGTG_12132 [Puccinia graminis f. sp. tritici CRL 75-36-700-3]|uniref:L-type lectin-like domain-containing protein n=1 Tax=Puccinia graminis f. sp. tritici (strain CRL 75-36-700-3 / race SCCL) TaxID=418459 RepID=E3KPF1_PUCGT|nr:uncharacterized protein PGTG_12132 [Puccinia graminis f. sp. tritici CRL 75-36-700-3]EFP86176.1 hypothetical protein PGTG_12132 [Puccinia graminis f. sp. tritici CRL 75-36-700-3]